MTKSPPAYEYHLSITRKFDERLQGFKTVFLLETKRLFASFRYELAVQETIEDKTIRFAITGLKPPALSIPSSGPARFRREFSNLNGVYKVVIEGLDHSVNSFSIRISQKGLHLVKADPHPFTELLIS